MVKSPDTFAHHPFNPNSSTSKMSIQIFAGGGHQCSCKHRKHRENQTPVTLNFLKGAADD